MPRYHLRIRFRDRVFLDREGEEFPSEIEVKQQALESAQSLMRTRSLVIPDWLDCTLEVTDSAGEIALTLPFADLLQTA